MRKSRQTQAARQRVGSVPGEEGVLALGVKWFWAPIVALLLSIVAFFSKRQLDRLKDIEAEAIRRQEFDGFTRRLAMERASDLTDMRRDMDRVTGALEKAADRLENHAEKTTEMGQRLYDHVGASVREVRAEVREARSLAMNATGRPGA